MKYVYIIFTVEFGVAFWLKFPVNIPVCCSVY